MVNLIAFGVIALAVGTAIGYIRKEKKRGARCAGCPYGGNCTGCKGSH